MWKSSSAAAAIAATLLSFAAGAQPVLLQSGPMPGHCEERKATIWVQTAGPAPVELVYRDTTARGLSRYSKTVITEEITGCTALLVADSVEPGKSYSYEIRINGQIVPFPLPLYFHTLPAAGDSAIPFRFAAGSCSFVNDSSFDPPGKGYGGGYAILDAISSATPDFMLWLGDHIYLRRPDWKTREGIIHRYSHTRSLPEMRRLLASTHHYAIWDDHDFGPNDADGTFENKELTLELFKTFWVNGAYGGKGLKGIFSRFSYGDADFFLLDDRYYRTPADAPDPTELGREQVEWLFAGLRESKASFKFIATGGQFLNPAAVYETYANYAEERQSIIDRIEKEKIRGVIFLTGDRHHTELSKLLLPDGRAIYDLTVSPLTSGPYAGGENEGNFLRVEGTYVNRRNFAVLTLSGSRGERWLQISVYDEEGKELWKRNIQSGEL